MLIIYTDGSSRFNPGPGGFGVVVCESWDGNECLVIDAHQETTESTTNNREEMKAIIWALENYGDESHRGNGFVIPTVYSDSMYCVNSFTNWIHNWKANGWTRAKGKPLENLDLIKKYDELINKGHKINLQYVKGHSDNTWNNLADGLATGRLSAEEVMKEYGNG